MSKLDVYLSNIFVFNQKLHNLHWNVEGLQFKPVHEYLEEIYDGQFEKLDEVAEYYRMNGKRPPALINDYLKNATIKEVDADRGYSVKETLEIVLDDLTLMHDLAVVIRGDADEDDNFKLVNIMEAHAEEYTKQIWFIKSMLV